MGACLLSHYQAITAVRSPPASHGAMQFYRAQAALAASQEEAAACAAAAAQAQARADAMEQRLQHDAERRASHGQAGLRIAEGGSPAMLEQLLLLGQPHWPSAAAAADGQGQEARALLQKLRAQRSEIDVLSSELEAANAKRAEAAKQVTALAQRVLESEIRVSFGGLLYVAWSHTGLGTVAHPCKPSMASSAMHHAEARVARQSASMPWEPRGGGALHARDPTLAPDPRLAQERELASTGETLRQQLSLVQQQLDSRQAIIQQLTAAPAAPAVHGGGPRLSTPSSPTSTSRSLTWHGDYPASPRSQATTEAYHSTLTLSPNSRAAAAAARAGCASGDAPAPHQHQHQQQSSKLERVVAMWKDACRAKDAQVHELQVGCAAKQRAAAAAAATEPHGLGCSPSHRWLLWLRVGPRWLCGPCGSRERDSGIGHCSLQAGSRPSHTFACLRVPPSPPPGRPHHLHVSAGARTRGRHGANGQGAACGRFIVTGQRHQQVVGPQPGLGPNVHQAGRPGRQWE